MHPGAQQPHAVDVERLAAHVLLPHVDVALHVEQRRRRGRGHAMLSRAGLCEQTGFAHLLRQQRLAEHVVDLVRARVVEILALEIDLGAAKVSGHLFGMVEARRAPGIVLKQIRELRLECRVLLVEGIGVLKLGQRPHEPFRDILAAVNAKSPLGCCLFRHEKNSFASFLSCLRESKRDASPSRGQRSRQGLADVAHKKQFHG